VNARTANETGQDAAGLLRYVLVTPARNEAQFIGLTMESVMAQTVRPLKWVIVSDGSTDGTDEIVRAYGAQHGWIELVRLTERAERHFAGKVLAINAGLERVRELPYDVLACLDADITFGPEYMAFLLGKLQHDPGLGLVGTPYRDVTCETYDYRYASSEHVSGACQVFRRACFEEIGGYVAVRGGAIDSIAATSARMKGWKTRSFPEKSAFHHRVIGTAEAGRLRARFNLGQRDYLIGNHPLWQVFRCAYQMRKRPLVLRGLALAAGYLRASLRRTERPVTRAFVAFRRREQMQRLAEKFRGVFPLLHGRRREEAAQEAAMKVEISGKPSLSG
jgi:biofilm PGA synthesis N-glycosyltransferase PgaC